MEKNLLCLNHLGNCVAAFPDVTSYRNKEVNSKRSCEFHKKHVHEGCMEIPEWTGMDTGMDWNGHRNGHRHGPEWTPERTRMDTGTDTGKDRNGPEDTMKSLGLNPLFDIRIEKSLNIFT